MMWRSNVLLVLSALLLLTGCDGERDTSKSALEEMAGGSLKETIPVSGTVFIDGTPTGSVIIYAYTDESGTKAVAQTTTGADGKYCWTTHQACDGIPPGKYNLAFAHVPDEGKGKKQGEDTLKNKYRNPNKNAITLEVSSGGQPQTGVDYKLEK